MLLRGTIFLGAKLKPDPGDFVCAPESVSSITENLIDGCKVAVVRTAAFYVTLWDNNRDVIRRYAEALGDMDPEVHHGDYIPPRAAAQDDEEAFGGLQ